MSVASKPVCLSKLALALAACLISAAQASAADLALPALGAPVVAGHWTFHALDVPVAYTGEVGLRFWYGQGRTGKNLYDPSGSLLVSRLTYSGLSLYSVEGFGRFDLNTGWFLKGLVGGGGFRRGNLVDEDFPPGISPYSATLSVLDNSYPVYGTIDAGYNVLRGPDFRVGAFAGYHFLHEAVSAEGCGQIATNPFICGMFRVPGTITVITQDNTWQALRLGFNGAADITDRLKFELDAAWLPFVWLNGTDAHWLRIGPDPGDFTGPVPEDGTGWGYQLEGILSYRVTDFINVGIGGRYWHMQTKGLTHFEGHVVDFEASPQPVVWKTDNYGVFLQTSLKFGPYSIIGRN